MAGTPLRVDAARLEHDLTRIGRVGAMPQGGTYRAAYSTEDQEAQSLLRSLADAADLPWRYDTAGNLSVRLGPWDGPPAVVTGSHLDGVPHGGSFDGVVGVVAGLEALRRIKEERLNLVRPVELIAFADEEGRFGPMIGAHAIIGSLPPGAAGVLRDRDGVLLGEAMRDMGLDPAQLESAKRDPAGIHCFVELHIEQGPVLENAGIPIGVVEGIAGLFRWRLTYHGAARHAGTTPMNARKDALRGMIAFAQGLDDVLAQHGSGRSVATIGNVTVKPNAANVVPGRVDFTLDCRDLDLAVLERLGPAFRAHAEACAAATGLDLGIEELSRMIPVASDPDLLSRIRGAADALAHTHMEIPSGAAHDALAMARITPTAMIFIPSRDGISHHPDEYTPPAQVAAGADVLLNVLAGLATEGTA